MVRSNFETCPEIKKFVRPVPQIFPCPNCIPEVGSGATKTPEYATPSTKSMVDPKRSSRVSTGVYARWMQRDDQAQETLTKEVI